MVKRNPAISPVQLGDDFPAMYGPGFIPIQAIASCIKSQQQSSEIIKEHEFVDFLVSNSTVIMA